jgi:hypothetical protein
VHVTTGQRKDGDQGLEDHRAHREC